MVLLYAAPDAESVRTAERHGRRRAARTWAFQWIGPDARPAWKGEETPGRTA